MPLILATIDDYGLFPKSLYKHHKHTSIEQENVYCQIIKAIQLATIRKICTICTITNIAQHFLIKFSLGQITDVTYWICFATASKYLPVEQVWSKFVHELSSQTHCKWNTTFSSKLVQLCFKWIGSSSAPNIVWLISAPLTTRWTARGKNIETT